MPEGLARIISLQYLALACLLGGLSGTILCLALRLCWKVIVFAEDMAIAGITTTILFVGTSWIEWRKGIVSTSTGVLFFVVLGSIAPIVHHLVRFTLFRNRHDPHPSGRLSKDVPSTKW